MKKLTTIKNNFQPVIDTIKITSDTLTGRGGLSLFVRYLRGIKLYPHLQRLFGSIRKSRKGQSICEMFKQLFCFFLDGTSRHLVHFDALQEDNGYAAAMESDPENLLSSHAVKRFFQVFSWPRIWLFRRLLQRLFLWRLKREKPSVILLGLDPMVMDNDEAQKRHGVQPTYRKVKGFMPLQLTWGRFVIDAVFRGGKKHSNHGDTVLKMVTHIVNLIRKNYHSNIPIVIRLDSGFFDQKIFECFEKLQIGYICGGKLYDDIKDYVSGSGDDLWNRLEKDGQAWNFLEFGDRRQSWDRFRRAIFCRPLMEDKQLLFEFARPDTLLYTNLGMGQSIDQQLQKEGMGHLLEATEVIRSYHSRGRDELVHRALKDFASETLPFKRFAPNAAFYYTMLVAFFLFETFKEDVCQPVVPVIAYATTIRRRIIDIAAKIVCHAGKIILKVPEAIWKQLRIQELWQKSGSPPSFVWG
ncbi:MAG: IS1380 family transposase [Acidobacteriota bacterium]